ncbi:HAD family hydrolase, partial [Candidatus Bathyarchaeota archaeon]|nr:HAD family hydrolase [Candidatus Bathyarchaeota archaeon]
KEFEAMIKAVIFDLDGTIVDFNLDYKSVRAEVIQVLNKQGFPSSIFSMNESIFSMLEKAEIYVRNNGRRDIDIARVKEEALSVANRHELQAAHTTRLVPGILETLKTINKMKLKMAIFTVNGEKSASYILRSFRLKRFFDAMITRESVSAVKPDPTHLEAALRALNVEPGEAIVVGDSKWDMECAQELNVIAVGVETGISSPKELISAGAAHLISSAIHLPDLIRQLNGQLS